MGHRANLIVVREGRYDLRYSHWAANTLTEDLFWGPEHAIAFTEAQPSAGTDWLDDVWAEGGSVIDIDRRAFLLFGGADMLYNVPLRRLYLPLLGELWRDWSVEWADEGIADLADRVGYPRERVLSRKPNVITSPDLRPPENPDWLEFVGCVAGSVRLGDGSLRLFPLTGDPEGYLMGGPALAEAAAAQPGMDRLALAEWTSSFPYGGFHLDLRSSRLDYWTSKDHAGIPARIAARWTGWTVTWLRDRYEGQLAACDGLLSFPTVRPEALFAQLRSMLLYQREASPIEALLWFDEQERAAGKVVQVNPLSLRDDRVEFSADAKAEILRRAAAQLGLPAGASHEGRDRQTM